MTAQEIKLRAQKLIEEAIEQCFTDLHQEAETKSGDIAPDQAAELDQLQASLARILTIQVWQNLPDMEHEDNPYLLYDSLVDDPDLENMFYKKTALPTDMNEWTRLSIEEAKAEGLFREPMDDLSTDFFAYYNKALRRYDAVIEMDMRGQCIGSSYGMTTRGTFPDVVEFYNSFR